ncbi:MAG: prepilin-type N-terminal cleavage/methylation domain-containing protein [Planctomycetes bacterium]|nr:prepilin-type N-terminal cleavage/methylation domain-containing protein [Planctomycetota bacterium]
MRRGMTLLEVMIAVAVLAVVLSSVFSSIATLDLSERLMRERAIAQQVAKSLAEQVMGSTWDTLGQDVGSLSNRNAWSWHRRENPLTGASLPPMDEISADPLNRLDELRDGGGNIISPAVVAVKTGLADLQVHLEYYRMESMDDMLGSADPAARWRQLTQAGAGDPFVFADTGGVSMDLRPVLDAVLVRVLVTWTPHAVGPGGAGSGRYQLVCARRK